MKRLVVLTVVFAGILAGSASADQGQIIGARGDSTGKISVSDLSVTWTQCGNYKVGSFTFGRDCGAVAEVVAHYCPDEPGSGIEIWSYGGVHSAGTRSSGEKSAQVSGSGDFSVCLYARNGEQAFDFSVSTKLLDTATVTVTRPTPTLSRTKASKLAKKALVRKFGRSYSAGNHKSLTCIRQSKSKFACVVSWAYRGSSYSGNVTVEGTSRTTVRVRVRR